MVLTCARVDLRSAKVGEVAAESSDTAPRLPSAASEDAVIIRSDIGESVLGDGAHGGLLISELDGKEHSVCFDTC